MYRSILIVALATAFLLSIPLGAMRFTDEMRWGLGDFIFAGTLLFGTGVAYVLASRKGSPFAYRAAVGLALLAMVLLIWINLAVGIIGAEDNPANLMYAGVIALGVIGALLSRCESRGMARAMFAAAIAQALVAGIALVAKLNPPSNTPVELLLLNGIFVALFAGSAGLFWRAAREPGR